MSTASAAKLSRSKNEGIRELVIASGDRDFIPLVSIAHELKWLVEMVAFSSAFSSYGEMAMAVDTVRPLDGSLDLIGHCAFNWP